jgi:RND family efflux transporter MFP subunit
MDDKNVLLNQLRIDRTAVEDHGSTRRWVLIGSSIVLVVALGAGAWWFMSKPSGIPVADAVARGVRSSSSNGAAARGASMLDASGYVVARRSATVASKIIGRVVEVHIEEGQRVKEGEVIAKLDDAITRANLLQARAQLQQAEANLAASKVALDDALPIFQRNERQMQASVISAQTFDTAKAAYNAAKSDFDVRTRAIEVAKAGLTLAERNQDDTVVRAPFAGVVTVKAAQAGEIVSPQSAGGGFTRTGIGTIVDMDSLEVEVDVSENFINRVRPEQPATIKLNAYPDWEIPAAVIAVIPTADRSKATVKVRVAFKEKDDRVLPEMGARVSFLSSPETPAAGGAPVTAQQAVLVPNEAVQPNGETGAVFIINGNNTVERRVVRLGSRTSEGQLVLSGISPGTRVVNGHLDALTDGAKVYVDPQAASKQGEGS